jgi:hypothetical protein
MTGSTTAWRVGRHAAADTVVADTAPVVASGRSTRARTTAGVHGKILLLVLFLASHVPLALAMARFPEIATAHAVATLVLGAWMAVAGGRLERVAMIVAYMVGAEVLWRMNGAQVNWEFAKYAGAAIVILALLRHRRLRPPLLPFAYFVLLLPSVALTFSNEDFSTARDQISFNLSGPFAIFTCAWLFSNVQFSSKDLRSVFIAAIGPAVGVMAIAAAGTFYGTDIVFYDSSNIVSSGGFGPNQVSAILGLGALLALFVAFDRAASRGAQIVMGLAMIGLAAQSALTFSRGGLYEAIGAAAVAACFALKDARLRSRLVPLIVVVFVIGNYFVYPYLDAFTGGQLAVRFQDTALTGRDRLIRADIELWKDNPILGVGPGGGRAQRGAFFMADSGLRMSSPKAFAPRLAAHTEFSRLLSEHGTLGLAALLFLVAGTVINVKRAPTAHTAAITAGLACWSALFMVSNGMRLLAPSFVVGIGFAALLDDGIETIGRHAQTRLAPRGARDRRPLTAGHPALRKPLGSDRLA